MSAKNNSKQLKNMGAFANKRVGNHTWIMFPGVMKTLLAMATPTPQIPARASKRKRRNVQYHLYPSKIAIISETWFINRD